MSRNSFSLMIYFNHKQQIYGDAYEQILNVYCELNSCFIYVSYKNSSTDIIVKSFEKLLDLKLPFDTEFAAFEKGPDCNSAFLMKVGVAPHINEEVNTYETLEK